MNAPWRSDGRVVLVAARRPYLVILAALALGIVVGVVTPLGQARLDHPFSALVNSASCWLIAPFLVGAICRRMGGAAIAGLAVCLLQLLAYYSTQHVRGFSAGEAIVTFWFVCGLVGGPLFGAAGYLWRHGDRGLRGLGGTALAAAFLAEGLWTYWHKRHYESTAALWFLLALLMLGLFSRRPDEFRWLAVTFPAALVGQIILTTAYSNSFG